MGEILMMLILFIAESVLELVLCIPLDYLTYKYEKKKGKGEDILFYLAFSVIFGAIFGVASVMFFPHALIPWGWMRIANLIIAPCLVGFAYGAIAILYTKKKEYVFPKTHFWSAFIFVLCIMLIRFIGLRAIESNVY
jgi:hypothetical protein